MSLKTSLLAPAFTWVDLVIMGCVVVLLIALLVSCIVLLAKTNKRNDDEMQPDQQPQAPVIIHLTKKVEVPAEEAKEVEEEVAPAPVEEVAEEPAPAPVEEVVEEVVPETEVAVAEAPAVVPVEEEYIENTMRYNRSFRARLIQADDEIKEWYGALKNDIMAYDRVSSRISWKYESFSYRRNPVARVFIKGKTLYLYLPLNAADYEESKYKLEDVSNISQFAETPALYRLKSERRVKYALELIAEICAKLGSEKREIEPVDYYEPYCSDLALIEKGLVKRVIEDANTSFIATRSKAQDDEEEAE